MNIRHSLATVAILVTAGCSDTSPVPANDNLVLVEGVAAARSNNVTLAVSPRSAYTQVTAGSPAPDGASNITLSGKSSGTKSWTVTKTKPWITLTVASGQGSGVARWRRNTAGLTSGLYVDTLTVTAVGAANSPTRIIDSLRIASQATTPVALSVTPGSLASQTTAGGSLPNASAQVVMTGTSAWTTNWTATKRKAWTTLIVSAGVGNGTVSWSRNTAALAAGTYVDTIAITASGATGSPAVIVDVITITAAPVSNRPVLGLNGSLNGRQIFPASSPWNQPVDTAQIDANSSAILTQIGLTKSLHPDFGANWNGGPFGIPYIVVPDNQPRLPVTFMYSGESDVGPYPIPANPPIEPSSDRHLLMVTQDEFKVYELFSTGYGAPWTAGSGAIFDLINGTTRPAGWTSADAAGLPILPGLVRYDEVVERGAINHALRFTVVNTRRAYVAPASHWASSSTDPLRPPMGMRVRLKASVNIASYPAEAQVILRALKKYGMFVADNGGDFFLSGTADARWNDAVISTLKQIKVSDFEVIRMTNIITN